MSNKPTVVVTGFGPFQKFADNPSSSIIDELQKEGIEGVNLILHKLVVAYKEVGETVPQLWTEHNPDLIIHIGAHQVENIIKFEQQAFADGYKDSDINGCLPEGNCTGCCRAESILHSTIDCAKLAQDVSTICGLNGDNYGGLRVCKSNDPGRYLCGFSYYLSLDKDTDKALFIHVPPFKGDCDKVIATNVIRQAVKCILMMKTDKK